jgi:hypothetical protein
METLFAGQFGDYLRETSAGQGPWIFVHVPKTAGTSLRNELAKLLQPDSNIMVDYTDTSRSFHERMDDAVNQFLAEHAARPYAFASGHILGRHVSRIRQQIPDARFVTFLRDPVARLVSDYRYQRSPKHPVHADFIARVPSFEAYLELRPERNKMAQHLLPPDVLLRGDPEECIDSMLRTYCFIGVQEMYPISFRCLTTLLGTPLWPRLRENVGSEADDELAMSPEVIGRVREVNPLDCALYDAVFPRLAAVRDGLARHLG